MNLLRRVFVYLDWATMTHGQRQTAELLNDGLAARLRRASSEEGR